MNYQWKEVWEKRTGNLDQISRENTQEFFEELKRIDGFDITGKVESEAWANQHKEILHRLSKKHEIRSVFDVGCGCGANLYLFFQEGLQIGGLDYSKTLIDIAKEVFGHVDVLELILGEAREISTEIKYDSTIANSVFSYFSGEEYAKDVLERMVDKARYSVGLLDLHDIRKKDRFLEYRRRTIENYDERYKNLPKFFYRKEFFIDFAKEKNLEIDFFDTNVNGYWNNEFVFDVYLYKERGNEK
ncbi:MAG: class I SAM-dependent methyltransferase [Lachnospiraceae bacterium]|nr:class I SAM-dependent methyltransferase [Lachnospiraceae bacterium]